MQKVTVCINGIEAVKDFVCKAQMCKFDIDIARDRYVVDAKSLMGVFSLDCSKPLELTMHTDDATEFVKAIEDYIIK